jgi:hypothetical protein
LFTFHWYAGEVPPLPGLAVNVMPAPIHIGFAPEAMAAAMEAGVVGITVITMTEVVAVKGTAQTEELAVTMQVTVALLASVA